MSLSAFYECEFGYWEITYNEGVILGITLATQMEHNDNKCTLTQKVYTQLQEYLLGQRKSFDFPYELKGTAFQLKVWNELLKIPYGQTVSYQDIATKIGDAKASRAVGNANNVNPMLIVVPCHRVIGKNGKLTGYAYGLQMKQTLLEIEKLNA